METETKPKVDTKKVVITLLLVVLTAGAVGGGVYYVLNQNFQRERLVTEGALKDLQDKVMRLTETNQQNSTESSTKTPATSSTTLTRGQLVNTYTNNECNFSFKYPDGYKVTTEGQRNAIFSSARFWAPDNGFDAFCTGGDASLIKSYSDYSTGTEAMKYMKNNDGTVSYYTVANNGKLISIQFSDPNNSFEDLKTKVLSSLLLN